MSYELVVTGGSGFLGSAIVREAVAEGWTIRTLTRRTPPPPSAAVLSWQGSLEHAGILDNVFAGAGALIHSAGLAHVFNPSADTAREFLRVNVQGTRQALEAAIRAGVSDWVLVSSVSVYGGGNPAAVDESAPCHPQGDYAWSKLEAENVACELACKVGARLTILRMATLFGEGDPGNIQRLITAVHRRSFVPVGGENRKTLLYVADAARACLLAVNAPASGVRIFNVTDSGYTMKEIVKVIADGLSVPAPKGWLPATPILTGARFASVTGIPPLQRIGSKLQKFLANDWYDGGMLRRALGFSPAITLAEGLKREIAWLVPRKARIS
jgi:nucleoside-diphosphate-sugar epimerase